MMSNSWIILNEENQLDEIVSFSDSIPVFIFKHSTTCGISAQAKENLEIASKNTDKKYLFYYLDLLNFRPISNEIASKFGVHHQSPQLILLQNGKVVFTTSHHKIRTNSIDESLSLIV
jgi:bacillithiol system protein YtxJ